MQLFEARTTTQAGSGILLQANALRVLRTAGVLDAVLSAGYAFNSTGVPVPDDTNRRVAELTEGRFDPACPRPSASPDPPSTACYTKGPSSWE